ncbi:flippase-like domain-containing protein [Candidatus Saccharibacteria bacterium]|nr:flippase-like domain-containing protein [Candidatus Saccharibacteria bacterium]
MKSIISWITLALVALIVFFSRHELVKAWELLGRVNLMVLLLLVPLMLFTFFASTETIFAYLAAKGGIKKVGVWERARMALELNFVNHTLPSGGVSGISYMTWRLGKIGVTPGRAASAQVVRYVAGFIASVLLIAISVLAVTIDGNVNRWIILVSSIVVTFMILSTIGMVYVVSSRKRMRMFAEWASKTINRITRKLTRGKKRVFVHEKKIFNFFEEMHDDYLELRRDYRVLVIPVLWAIAFTAAEASLFVITFWALGTPINPAPLLIAYILASVAGFIVVTPGGAGAYEAIMVAFLATAGIASGAAIAGIVLTRVIILVVTIAFGYFFYQHALGKYGKRTSRNPFKRI